ncbi:hypothetical protein GCM10022393_23470 [Aquimarina addita]|uniref:Ricin B lectin domain-containing protein n=2 Tax=Aquimarina addita TaxID=870485 RepID=A0ABP6UMQ1_9FLAO
MIARTIYVTPDGEAAFGVGTQAVPMNLAFGLNSASPGDTVLLNGTFTLSTNIYLQDKSDITIGEWGTGAILEGSTDVNSFGFPLIVLINPTNVTVENITFRQNFGNTSKGIWVQGQGDNINIRNCVFTNIGWTTSSTAIAANAEGAHAILVIGNQNEGSLTNVNITGNSVTNMITGTSESITLIGNVDGFLIADNYIGDVTNIGIDVAGHFSWVVDPDTGQQLTDGLNQARNGRIRNNTVTNAVSPIATSAGIYCDGCRDVIIERNIVSSSGAGISIGCEVGGGKTASGVTVMNNIFRDNNESGMFLGSSLSEGTAAGPSSVDNCVIKNNTFYNNGVANTSNDYEVFLQNSKNNQFYNNIVYIGANARGIVSAVDKVVENFTMDYNLFYRADGTRTDLVISAGSALSGNTNSQFGDPGFSGELNISNSSRAANTGNPATTILSGELDRNGGIRKQSSRVDIGAQESNSTQSSPTPNFNGDTIESDIVVTMRKGNATGFGIDGNNGGANGQNMYLWSYDANNMNQQWIEIDRGSGYYSYQKQNTNYCIDGGNGGGNGQNVYLWTCSANNQNQHWRKVDIGNGTYRLEKRNAPGFSIDGGQGGTNRQNVYLWSSNSANQNQQWQFTATTTAKNLESVDDTKATTEALSIEIYPVPAQDILYVSFPEESTFAKMEIIDATGKVSMTKKEISGNNIPLDISNFAKGIYFLKVFKDDASTETLRFLK